MLWGQLTFLHRARVACDHFFIAVAKNNDGTALIFTGIFNCALGDAMHIVFLQFA